MIADIISLSPTIVVLWPAFQVVRTGDMYYATLILTLLTGLIGIEHVLKPIFGVGFPFGRPAGASGCGLFCGGGSVGGRPGFPSGHAAMTTFLVLTLFPSTPVGLTAGSLWIAAVAWSRLAKRCHNLFQVAGGLLYGAALAYVFRTIG